MERGECDYLDSGIAAEYVRELPQAQLMDVADSGHALLEEQPDEVITAIRRFLADDARGPASEETGPLTQCGELSRRGS
jgi:hypothetical protein